MYGALLCLSLALAAVAGFPALGNSVVMLKDGRLLVMGGWNQRRLGTVWRSDADLTRWQLLADSRWEGRRGHVVVRTKSDHLLMIGGASDRLLGDVWRSADDGSTWSELVPTPTSWSARAGHSVAQLAGGDLLLLGGAGGDLGYPGTGGDESSPALRGDIWRSRDGGAVWCDASDCTCDPVPENPACTRAWVACVTPPFG